ncbi:MAG: hypothetical protein ACI9IO_000495 [Cyanobium sp.]|jgi:hypothetical protein
MVTPWVFSGGMVRACMGSQPIKALSPLKSGLVGMRWA